MKKIKLLALIATTALTSALTFSPSAHALDAGTENFLKGAAMGGEFEIESSKIALERSQDPEVRKFAQTMIIDHSKASGELKQAAKTNEEKNIINGMLDPSHTTKINELKTIDAKTFDTQYISDQSDAHDEAVDLFRNYSASGKDTDLKTFATKTLPTLEQHQQHVKELGSKL